MQEILKNNNTNVDLIFGGGTAISKCNKITERLSEDIDFKMSFKEEPESKNQKKKQLKQFREMVEKTLKEIGYRDDQIKKNVRNDGNNVYFMIENYSIFEEDGYHKNFSSYRDGIKIEFTTSDVYLEPETHSVSSILNKENGDQPEIPAIKCVNINETAAEKFVSLTRRTAAFLENGDEDKYDRFLVRHIYDLAKMAEHIDKDTVNERIIQVIEKDIAAFKNNEDYAFDPIFMTNEAMEFLGRDEETRERFEKFQDDMVYGDYLDFDEALEVVNEIHYGLIEYMNQNNLSFKNGELVNDNFNSDDFEP